MAVNLSPVGGVAAQFFTNTGAVLTGGKIYTYAAGTTTPAVAYTSSNGLTPWANPIVLDAAGRVSGSGEIWLTDGISYKFVLKDSNDVLIATYDNVTGINSNSISFTNSQQIITATAGQTVFNLSISYQPGTNSLSVFVDGVNQYGPGAQYAYTETDSDTVTFVSGLHVGAQVKFTTTQQQGAGAVNASQVAYDPAGTGAVATNVQAKLRQVISVKDFGAVGDGVTDDAAAIQLGLNWLLTSTSSAELTFPPGDYKITAPLYYVVTSNSVLMKKISGHGARLVGALTTATPMLSIAITGAYNLRNFVLEGLGFAGGGSAAQALLLDAGATGYMYLCVFRDIFIETPSGDGLYVTNGVFQCSFYSISSYANSNTSYPIKLVNGGLGISSLTFIDCNTQGGLIGLYAAGTTNDVKIISGTYISAQQEGIKFDNSLDCVFNAIHVENNWNSAASLATGGAGITANGSATFVGITGTTDTKQKYVVQSFVGASKTTTVVGGAALGSTVKFGNFTSTDASSGLVILGGDSLTYDKSAAFNVTVINNAGALVSLPRRVVQVSSGASISLTPDPRNGNCFFLNMTGNATINNPTYTPNDGDEMEFTGYENGSGGYSITFGANYAVNWTPVTTFGKTNSIKFRYFSQLTKWVQISSAVGV